MAQICIFKLILNKRSALANRHGGLYGKMAMHTDDAASLIVRFIFGKWLEDCSGGGKVVTLIFLLGVIFFISTLFMGLWYLWYLMDLGYLCGLGISEALVQAQKAKNLYTPFRRQIKDKCSAKLITPEYLLKKSMVKSDIQYTTMHYVLCL